MDLQAEKEKINEILKSGMFTYKSIDFIIDVNATNTHPANVNLGPQKGLMKFVGSDPSGQINIAVFSHLVEIYNPDRHLKPVAEPEIDHDPTASPLIYPEPETEDWERSLEEITPKPKGKKKKHSD